MSKWSISLLCLAGAIAVSPSLHAQALPTATRGGGGIQAGVGVTLISPDYADNYIKGYSAYADYDFTRLIGVEIGAHVGNVITPDDISQNSYYVGPRFMYHRRKLGVFARIAVGRATITDQEYGYNNPPYFGQSRTFNMYSFAAGAEYKIKKHYNIRAEVEEQKWPDFEPHTLSPIVITVGVAYVIR